jgi:hypothetical protein
MNLENNPTLQQLSSLLGSVDDSRSSHNVWVDREGNVHISRQENFTPYFWPKGGPDSKMCDFTSSCEVWRWHDANGQIVREEKHPLNLTPKPHPVVKFHFETYIQGNGYCGVDAARDKDYVRKEFEMLVKAWRHNYEGHLDADYWVQEEVTVIG